MAWVAVDKDGRECIHIEKPYRDSTNSFVEENIWYTRYDEIELPQGTIKKLIGRELTWNDEPVELK